ncbi:DUF3309 domain-containing protein [Sinorhizobium meliloti]|nr:DUF3309 domain-containing protein [Sinorhizobium meliloti]
MKGGWHDERYDGWRHDVGHGGIGILSLLMIVLVIAALIKYVFFR